MLALGALPLVLGWGFLGQCHSPASTPVRIDSNDQGYTTRNFHVRSPLRVLSDALDFMPHGRSLAVGRDRGYAAYLCKDGARIERLHGTLPDSYASLRADGAFYAFSPPAQQPTLTVVRVDDGERWTCPLPAWGYLGWAAADRIQLRQKGSGGVAQVVAELPLPADFVR